MTLPILFLLLSVLGVLITLNTYVPNRSRPRLSMVSFLLGWLTAELALHHVAWSMLLAALLIHYGALASWPGQVGLAIAVVSWAALIVDYFSGWRSRGVIAKALDDGLGKGWRERIRPELAATLKPMPLGQLIFPLPVRRSGLVKTANVAFYEEPRFKLRLDVYRHHSKPVKTPTLIYVHGGAWVIGDKSNQGLPQLHHLASMGWTCFGVNYRLSPRATFPDHIIDVKRAIAWVKQHGAEYGADPGFILITGGSAGGHLAALAALTPDEKDWQPGFESVDCSVNACAPLYGVLDFTNSGGYWPHPGLRNILGKLVMKGRIPEEMDAWKRASPVHRVSQSAPPFFVIQGSRDSLVPPREAEFFAERLRVVSSEPVAAAVIPGAQHAFEVFPSPRTACSVEGIAAFGTYFYSRYLDRKGGVSRD